MQSENICRVMALELCLAPCLDGHRHNTPSSILARDGHIGMDRMAFCFPRLLFSGLELSSKEFSMEGSGSGIILPQGKACVVPLHPKKFYFSAMSDIKTGLKPQL